MKLPQRILLVIALGVLAFLAKEVFTVTPENEDVSGARSRPARKFLTVAEPAASPGTAAHQNPENSATTRFRVLRAITPDFFNGNKPSAQSPVWMETQAKSIRETPVLDRVVEKLHLAEDWRVTSAAAAAKLRGMTKVALQKEADVLAITVTAADTSEAAELANAVRDAYTAWRKSLAEERFRRLFANTEAGIAELQEKVAAAQSEAADSSAQEKNTPENAGYASSLRVYPDQAALLNTLKEYNARTLVEQTTTGETVEVLEFAKPAPAN